MTGNAVLFGNFVLTVRGATSLEKARKALSSLTVRTLRKATVELYDQPDTTNPSGYYDRWVVLKYRVFFGLIKRDKTLFYQPTCDELGEEEQKSVHQYALNILNAVQ